MDVSEVEECLQKATYAVFDTEPRLIISLIFTNKTDAYEADWVVRSFLSTYKELRLFIEHNGHLDISFISLVTHEIGNIKQIDFERSNFMSFTNLNNESDDVYLAFGFYEPNGIQITIKEIAKNSKRPWYDFLILISDCQTQMTL